MGEIDKDATRSVDDNGVEEFLVAIDDGHSEIKVAFFESGTHGPIRNFSFPSRTVRGFEDMDPSGGAPPDAYIVYDLPGEQLNDNCLGTQMLVVERGRSGGDSENRTTDYPVSDRNRVLVHHALHKIADGRQIKFNLATALPYSDFHLPSSGKHNKQLIEDKKASLRKSVMAIDKSSFEPRKPTYQITEQAVFSEGVATFFDCMIEYRDDRVDLDRHFSERFEHSRLFAIIDIGGKTTDIVFGSWSGKSNESPLIRVQMSSSLKEGTLDAADQLGELIKSAENLRRVIDPEKILFTKKAAIFGVPRDVSHLVDKVVDQLFLKIREPLLKHLDDASDMAYVIFAGGGSILMTDKVEQLFPRSVIHIPPEPQYANANGMLKLLKLEHSNKA